jgi:hypothetical protein
MLFNDPGDEESLAIKNTNGIADVPLELSIVAKGAAAVPTASPEMMMSVPSASMDAVTAFTVVFVL